MSATARQKQISAVFKKFLKDPEQWDMSLAGTESVFRLECRFSELVGHPHALAVANATTGLWAAFIALEINNAEIITTPYTWAGSLAGLIYSGNRPVFADIHPDCLTIDPDKVIEKITPETKAILAVDIYGFPCDGPALRKIADKYGLVLIQDCAQSFGAYIEKMHTGWWADMAVFSMGWNKALFAGEGGMILTPHEDVYQRLVWHTQHPTRQKRDLPSEMLNEFAMNLRINPLAAIWAEQIFDDALNHVDERRRAFLDILKILVHNGLSATPVPGMNNTMPCFHTFVFEPTCEPIEIEKRLQAKKLHYTLTEPPISRPLYCHDTFKRKAAARKWPDPNCCTNTAWACENLYKLQPIKPCIR